MNSAVHFDDFMREGKQVLNPLAARLDARPQFQVLDSVVVPDAVAVMDRFARSKVASDVFFHDEAMDKLPLASPIHIAPDVATWVGVVLSSADKWFSGPALSLHFVVDEAQPVSRMFSFTVLYLAYSQRFFHSLSMPSTVTLCILCRREGWPDSVPSASSSRCPLAFPEWFLRVCSRRA
jgi:hypothetical protein